MSARAMLQSAQLALASYAALLPGSTGAQRPALETDGVGMTSTQAREFTSVYTEVVTTFDDTRDDGGSSSGFQVAVLEDASGNLSIAFRGVFGPEDIPAALDIGGFGAAYSQIVAMANWWARASAPVGQSVQQFRLNSYPVGSVPSGAVVIGTDAASAVVLESALSAAAFSGDKNLSTALALDPDGKVDVTGHSLGGHLAMAFSSLFTSRTGMVTVFNAPGFIDSAVNQAFFAKLGGAIPTSGSIVNVAADEALADSSPFNWIAGLHSRPGQQIDIAIEKQVGSGEPNPFPTLNHSVLALADSLAILALLSDLDPTLDAGGYKLFLNRVAQGTAASHERIVDMLKGLFGINDPLLPYGNKNREALYQAIYGASGQPGLLSNALYQSATVTKLKLTAAAASAATLLQQVQDATGIDRLAYLYALTRLNTIVAFDNNNVGLYARFQAGGAKAGELDAYNAAVNPQGVTPSYLQDRAAFLERKAYISTLDLDSFYQKPGVSDPNAFPNAIDAQGQGYQREAAEYLDLTSGLRASTGGSTDSLQHFVFGGDRSEAIVGANQLNRGDHLYGGDGNDLLTGKQGNDYIEGGKGNDAYISNGEDGEDTILDSDGRGVLLRNGAVLGLGFRTGADEWKLGSSITYTRLGGDLKITFGDAPTDSFTIRDFKFAEAQAASYLDVRLIETPVAPQGPIRTFVGDKADWDSDVNQTGVQIQVDSFGNTVRADGQDGRPDIAQPDRQDAFNGSAADEIERFDATGGDDTIYADGPDSPSATSGGRDLIGGGAGRDVVSAGANNDWVEGGSEGDILAGNAGDDILFADTSSGQTLTVAQAIQDGATGIQSPGPGDLLSGDLGKDTLIGGATGDLLAGGEDVDIIVGASGEDNIYGDGSVTSADRSWAVGRFIDGDGTSRNYRVVGTGLTLSVDPSKGGGDAIYGGAGADWVFAGAGDDYVEGGDTPADADVEDDVVFGEGGSDVLIGGSGNDFLHGDSATVDGLGLSGDDYLDGGAGEDTLLGGNGADILLGGAGIDTLSGGQGDDTLWGGVGDDFIVRGPGKDTYVYNRGDGTDVVLSNPEGANPADAFELALGEGITRSEVKFRLGSLMVDLGNGDAIHLDGFDPNDPLSTPVVNAIQFADGSFMSYQDILDQGFDLDGTEGDDVITGTAVTDRIDGKGGNDLLFGRTGADTILGGIGNDDLLGEDGDDILDGGDGFDTLDGGAGDDIITTGEGADIAFGGAGDDTINAGDGDLVVDVQGVNHLDLTAYAGLTAANLEVTQYQALSGETYLNFHVRDEANPGVTPASGGVSVQSGELGYFATLTVLDGAGGTVTLSNEEVLTKKTVGPLFYQGLEGDERLVGTRFDDTMLGGAGSDTINGNAGDDRIDGGYGDDMLAGGAGNDTYLLAYNGGHDTVIEDGLAEPNAVHTIQLEEGINSSKVKAIRAGDDLEVRLRATGDMLVLKDFYLQPQSWQDGWAVSDGQGRISMSEKEAERALVGLFIGGWSCRRDIGRRCLKQ